MTRPVFTARAHAKINLGLRITATRPDGFHELRTVFQALDLHDTLIARPQKGKLTLRCSSTELRADDTNLVIRAAEMLWRALGRAGDPAGVEVVLEKRIPIGAGLGGGSSDAAAALRVLAAVWRVRLPDRELWEVASRLGADVPYFLSGGTALGLGLGDEIYPLADLAPTWVVVLVPDFGVLTADAYRWFDEDVRRDRPRSAEGPPTRGAVASSPYFPVLDAWNDLEAPVSARHPEIGQMRRQLEQSGAKWAAMSGSGSCVYGLFPTRAGAASAARTLGRGRWKPMVTRAIGRRVYLQRAAPRRLRRLPPSVRIG